MTDVIHFTTVRVFLSYRRDDDPFAVGRIRDFLASALGDNNVFLDVLSIQSGANFESEIDDTISRSDVVLVVIGPRWEGSGRPGSVVDYVELEVGMAMQKGKSVVPVLLGHRGMPDRQALPGSLAALTAINAHRLRPDPDFRPDMQELLQVLGHSPGTRELRSGRERGRSLSWAAIAVVSLVVGVAAAVVVRSAEKSPEAVVVESSLDATTSSSAAPSSSVAPTTVPASTETTTADRNDGWYPDAEPVVAVLLAERSDELPDLPREVRGYTWKESNRPDEEPVVRGTGPLVHSIFAEWASTDADCDRIWWVAQWSALDPKVLVRAELVPASWLQEVDSSYAPSAEASHAGFMSSSGCQVPGLWFGEATDGSVAAATDIQISVAVFEINSEIADCHPMNRNEEFPLRLCDRGERVRRMQAELVRLGFDRIEVDGDFGPATERLVRAFQASKGLPDDGVVNTSTWLALFPDDLSPAPSTTG